MHIITCVSLAIALPGRYYYYPISQIRKQRNREVQKQTQSHTATTAQPGLEPRQLRSESNCSLLCLIPALPSLVSCDPLNNHSGQIVRVLFHSRREIKPRDNTFPAVKIKWLRTSLRFFLHYYILETLSLGAAAAATLVTLHFFLVLLVHALTAQTVLQTPHWQKGNGHIKGATDQEQNQAAEHRETPHPEFSPVPGLRGAAGRVPDTVCRNCTQHLGNPWREGLLAVA